MYYNIRRIDVQQALKKDSHTSERLRPALRQQRRDLGPQLVRDTPLVLIDSYSIGSATPVSETCCTGNKPVRKRPSLCCWTPSTAARRSSAPNTPTPSTRYASWCASTNPGISPTKPPHGGPSCLSVPMLRNRTDPVRSFVTSRLPT